MPVWASFQMKSVRLPVRKRVDSLKWGARWCLHSFGCGADHTERPARRLFFCFESRAAFQDWDFILSSGEARVASLWTEERQQRVWGGCLTLNLFVADLSPRWCSIISTATWKSRLLRLNGGCWRNLVSACTSNIPIRYVGVLSFTRSEKLILILTELNNLVCKYLAIDNKILLFFCLQIIVIYLQTLGFEDNKELMQHSWWVLFYWMSHSCSVVYRKLLLYFSIDFFNDGLIVLQELHERLSEDERLCEIRPRDYCMCLYILVSKEVESFHVEGPSLVCNFWG